jgi:FAD/FMN-containing dehydrogenase
MGAYLQPTVQGTNCHLEFDFGYDPSARGGTEKVRRFVEEAAVTAASMGAFFSRPYGFWAGIAYGREGRMVIGQRKLKDIFDPNGIMNPGKLCF